MSGFVLQSSARLKICTNSFLSLGKSSLHIFLVIHHSLASWRAFLPNPDCSEIVKTGNVGELAFDKDDSLAMNFVSTVSCAFMGQICAQGYSFHISHSLYQIRRRFSHFPLPNYV